MDFSVEGFDACLLGQGDEYWRSSSYLQNLFDGFQFLFGHFGLVSLGISFDHPFE